MPQNSNLALNAVLNNLTPDSNQQTPSELIRARPRGPDLRRRLLQQKHSLNDPLTVIRSAWSAGHHRTQHLSFSPRPLWTACLKLHYLNNGCPWPGNAFVSGQMHSNTGNDIGLLPPTELVGSPWKAVLSSPLMASMASSTRSMCTKA